jgi:DNA (cytosine-5)-methyltransferase 1
MKNTIFRFGELFCGPGGLALGAVSSEAENAEEIFRCRHTWANDYSPSACETYRRNICPDTPENVFCADVRDINLYNLSPIDAFAYGFPCNDFSLVGKQKGFNGAFGSLYAYGVEIINHFTPAFFVAENVEGLASTNNGKVFERILGDLESAGNGYVLTTHLYKAEDYGVPQTRHRVIIVGVDKKYGREFKVPAPLTRDCPVSVRAALEEPPISQDAYNNEQTKQSAVVVERLKYIKPGENAFNARLPDELKLNVRGAKISQIYKRLDPDKPSYTITGSGGGGTHGYHWRENRALTNRERARIQTFPDSFVFSGTKEQVRKQIGMAVPPVLSKILFTAIMKTFAGVPYPSISPSFAGRWTVPALFQEALEYA